MADLKTTYMGIPLANPLVVGACSLSKSIDSIKALEAAGAGGLVIKSLFEEQIQIEEEDFERKLVAHDNTDSEAQSFFPQLRHGGPKEHVFWVKEARKAVKFPLFASLNCINSGSWVEYAKQLADTGVNGLELNFYSPSLSPDVLSGDIEKKEADVVAQVRAAVKLPIAVKLHPYYTSLMNVAARFEKAGANALILFNRLFEPDIDVDAVAKKAEFPPQRVARFAGGSALDRPAGEAEQGRSRWQHRREQRQGYRAPDPGRRQFRASGERAAQEPWRGRAEDAGRARRLDDRAQVRQPGRLPRQAGRREGQRRLVLRARPVHQGHRRH
jgi:hypothetical protein